MFPRTACGDYCICTGENSIVKDNATRPGEGILVKELRDAHRANSSRACQSDFTVDNNSITENNNDFIWPDCVSRRPAIKWRFMNSIKIYPA